jgi:hypothetical protein
MVLWRSLIRLLLALALVCAPVAANAAGLHELGLGTAIAASDACDHDAKGTDSVPTDASSKSATSNQDQSDSKGHCGACCLLAHGFAGLMPAPVSEPAAPFAIAAHLIAPDERLAGRVLDPLNKPPRG